MFELQPHGADTFVGSGPEYPWGGLYGGQIVAQALRAAAETVERQFVTHSLLAYFIRRGDHREPIRYEVDRIRNGRSFVTRRVVARQATGAILNLEASFQEPEDSPEVQTVVAPRVPAPDELTGDRWIDFFDRRDVPRAQVGGGDDTGTGRIVRWVRLSHRLGGLDDPAAALDHLCWLAFMSDDLPADAVLASHPASGGEVDHERFFGASLDHTMWFHRPMRADEWHLYDASCHAFTRGRGLTIGHVFAADGTHTATFAQEFLAREAITPPS